jgi:hypothetical protein
VVANVAAFSSTQLLIDTDADEEQYYHYDAPGVPSDVLCGDTSRYYGDFRIHRMRANDDVPVISPAHAHIGPNGSQKFSVKLGNDSPVAYWDVVGGAANGFITSDGVYRSNPSNPLRRDNYVTIHARTYDGRDAYAFVAAQ